MKILVLGAYGMLGHQLVQVLSPRHEVHATCRTRRPELAPFVPAASLMSGVTAEDLDSVIRAIAQVRPDAVLNCIGVIKQRAEAKDPIPSLTVNSLFPHRLAQLCRAAGARLVHFSTDCVFSGRTGHYAQDAVSDAEDLYGRSKFLGEVGGEGALTIRSSIIGPELDVHSGLLDWFLAQRGKEARGYTGAIYTGFTTEVMAELVETLLTRHAELSGVWQVASPAINKFELLRLVDRKLGLGVTLHPDTEFRCDRSLDGSLFAARTGFVAPTWDAMTDGLARALPRYLEARHAHR